MCTFWIVVTVTLQLGSQWGTAGENIKSSPRSSADDVIAIAQQASSKIYLSTPGVYQIGYNNGQQHLTCDLCEPGHFLVKHCDTEHGTTCEQCPYNFHMPYYNNGDTCFSCGDTCNGDLYLVTLQECSPTARRRCACQPGTRPRVKKLNDEPAMCSPIETGTDSKHENVASLRGPPDHNGTTHETTATTTTSNTGNTTKWELDSSFANDTLSYDLAESESSVGPLASGLAGLAGIVVVAVVIGACCKGQSASKATGNTINRNVDWTHVFNYVADNIGEGWRHLARKLPGNIPTQTDLASIRLEHQSDVKEMAFQMLWKWKQMNGEEASLEGLQLGLRKSWHPLIARQIGKRQWPEMI